MQPALILLITPAAAVGGMFAAATPLVAVTPAFDPDAQLQLSVCDVTYVMQGTQKTTTSDSIISSFVGFVTFIAMYKMWQNA